MPVIIVSSEYDGRSLRKLADVSKKARRVFNERGGILPMPKGAVEIVPDFTENCGVSEIKILMYDKEGRKEKIEEIKRQFWEISWCQKVTVNPQPENLWITF